MTLRKQLKGIQLFDDLAHLIYPNYCLACEDELASTEQHLCSLCDSGLQKTSFHLQEDASDLDKLFWGRIELKASYAHYLFKKKSPIQTVLFNLKYKHNSSIGNFFGREIGNSLNISNKFNTADAILPVPLHHKKEFLRGYNQSVALANGISDVLKVPVDTSIAKRTKHTDTQTKKSRFERWDNVNSIFTVNESVNRYKHIIVVDDVVTTGSTIEALVQAIHKKAPSVDVSVVTLAIA